MSPDRPGAWPDRFVSGPEDVEALVVLSHLQRALPRDVHALARREGTARRCLEAVRDGWGSPGDRRIADSVRPREVLSSLRAARFVTPADREYPERLLDLADPPFGLYVRGRPLTRLRVAVAIVGARRCSAYGLEAADTIAAGLAAHGVTVVSGAARGVDAAAHAGALRVRGDTVAVLGSGIDVPFPSSSRALISQIARAGSVVSEYPPGTRADKRRFPARNRIVAVLASAVVVVQGAPGSGSRLTADFGMDLERDVLAVPGPIDHALSAVPHELLREGAGLAAEVEDVLCAVGLEQAAAGDDPVPLPPDLAPEERRLGEALSFVPATAETLAAAAGVALPQALVSLSALELRGIAVAEAGRYRASRRRPGAGDPSVAPASAARP